MQSPLNKVVFIQRIATFTKTNSLKDLFQLAYVNNSWNDTIKNYSFHLFEDRVRDIESATILEKTCDRVIKFDVFWFLDVLLRCKTVLSRINLARLVCKRGPPLNIARLVFERIIEAGGKELLKRQLVAPDDRDYGRSCLMLCCSNSSSPEVMKLVCEKIVRVGGTALLKTQLIASNNGGRSCLVLCCSNSSSPESVKLVLEQIVEVGGMGLLESQLSAKDNYGCNFLGQCCENSSSPQVMKLVAVVLSYVDLFKQQFLKLKSDQKSILKEQTGIDCSSSWTPDSESLAEVKVLLEGGSFIYAVYNNQHSRMKEILIKNDLVAKKILDSKFDTIIVRAGSDEPPSIKDRLIRFYQKYDPKKLSSVDGTLVMFKGMEDAMFKALVNKYGDEPTPVMSPSEAASETIKLLFSEIERIGGDQYLKELLLSKETCLLSACLHDSRKLKLISDTMEELGVDEAFLAEQFAQRNGQK